MLTSLFPHVAQNPEAFLKAVTQTFQMFFIATPFWFVLGVFFRTAAVYHQKRRPMRESVSIRANRQAGEFVQVYSVRHHDSPLVPPDAIDRGNSDRRRRRDFSIDCWHNAVLLSSG